MDTISLDSARDVITNLVSYLPTLLAGFFVLVLGAIIGVGGIQGGRADLDFSAAGPRVGAAGLGPRAGQGDVRHSLFGLVGILIGLLVFLVFLDNAVVIWKLTVLWNFWKSWFS